MLKFLIRYLNTKSTTFLIMDLLHAAESGRLSRVKELISKDKSLIRTCRHANKHNRSFNLNGSAIHYACRSGHYNVVKYILEQDPTVINDLDAEDWTPLHYACVNGHIEIVKLLLEYRPNVNIKDTFLSQTPIQFAMYKEFEDVVRLLDPNVQWKRRTANEIFRKGNVPVFRKKSNLFLGRYLLNDNHCQQIEKFRSNPQSDDIELDQIIDKELDNLQIRIRFTHNSSQHIQQTLDLTSKDMNYDDPFLRSSTISTNEHILIFPEN